MRDIFPGRFTAEVNSEFVIFVIGMRVNRWWLPHKWIPPAFAMPKMLAKLQADKSLGMLAFEQFFRPFPLTSMMISYWESFEKLEQFARDQSLPHASAWASYMKSVGGNGSVGIYHETYIINKGQYECIYGNMPRFGLASAFSHTSVTATKHSARNRIQS